MSYEKKMLTEQQGFCESFNLSVDLLIHSTNM